MRTDYPLDLQRYLITLVCISTLVIGSVCLYLNQVKKAGTSAKTNITTKLSKEEVDNG